MSDEFTEVSSQGWLSRIMASIKGVVFGLLLFAIAFPVLFINEGRAVKTHRALNEGQKGAVSVQADKVDPANEGKLVHLSGLATTKETIADSTFSVAANAIRLERTVEMYQWVEETKSETRKKLGGGTETIKTTTYEKAWKSSLEKSSEFKHPEEHTNPTSMPYEAKTVTAKTITVGAYTLSSSLVGKIGGAKALPATAEALKDLPATRKGHLQDGALYIGEDPALPAVGDVRVRWQVVMPADVSLAARQVGNTFEAYTTSNGRALELLEMGTMSSDAMFEAAKAGNAKLTWFLRLLGFLMMAIGLSLVFKPIAVLGDVVPFVGSLLEAGLGLVASIIALACSTVVISIAWITYRPLIGVPLLLVAIGSVVWMVMQSKKNKAAA